MIAVSLFTRFCAVFFAAVAAVVLPQIGPWKGFAYGTLIFSFNYAMFVLPPGQSGAYIQPMIKVAGEAFTRPTQYMYLAGVLQPSDMTRAQSAMLVAASVSGHDIAGVWVAFFSRRQRYRC